MNSPRFDEDGFLVEPHGWSETLARRLAAEDGVGVLGDDHWRVIGYLREHFLGYGTIPAMSHVCTINGLGPHCADRLFHSEREAWRVAGLPNPGEEAKSYMA